MGKTNNGLVWWQSFMAFYLTLTGAAVLGDIIGEKGSATAMAVGAALNAATAVYVAAAKPVETGPAAPLASREVGPPR